LEILIDAARRLFVCVVLFYYHKFFDYQTLLYNCFTCFAKY